MHSNQPRTLQLEASALAPMARLQTLSTSTTVVLVTRWICKRTLEYVQIFQARQITPNAPFYSCTTPHTILIQIVNKHCQFEHDFAPCNSHPITYLTSETQYHLWVCPRIGEPPPSCIFHPVYSQHSPGTSQSAFPGFSWVQKFRHFEQRNMVA